MNRRRGTALLLGGLLAACGLGEEAPARLRVATTTSTQETGLLDWLFLPFEAREGVKVDVVSVGTGQALEIGRRGDCDLVLVHDREREDAFVADGSGIDRRDLFWNDFVVVGPEADPARVAAAKDAAAALGRIRASGALFVSRGDKSGTHGRELTLWKAAGGKPSGPAYWETGGGMSATLTVADEKSGYTLVDRGSWIAQRGRLRLRLLLQGDAALRNPYGAILVNPARHPHGNAPAARRLLDYLTSPEGRARVAAFTKDGEVLFHPVERE